MLKLGDQGIKALYVGRQKIAKAYVGGEAVFQESSKGRLPKGYTELEWLSMEVPASGKAPYFQFPYTSSVKTINSKRYALSVEVLMSYPNVDIAHPGSSVHYRIIDDRSVYVASNKYFNLELDITVYSSTYSTAKSQNKHYMTSGIVLATSTTAGAYTTSTSSYKQPNKYDALSKFTIKWNPAHYSYDMYEDDVYIYGEDKSSIIKDPTASLNENIAYPINILGSDKLSRSSTFDGKLYSLKLFFGDYEYVYEFVPCKRDSDNMVGLFMLGTAGGFYAAETNPTYVVGGPEV